jgi:hypothetical protein
MCYLVRAEFELNATCRQRNLLHNVIVLGRIRANYRRLPQTLSRFRKDEEYKIFLLEHFPYAASRIIAAAVAGADRRPFQDECPRSEKNGLPATRPYLVDVTKFLAPVLERSDAVIRYVISGTLFVRRHLPGAVLW